MTATPRSLRAVAVALVLVVTTASAATHPGEVPDARASVRAEIARLQLSLKDKPITGAGIEGLASSLDAALKSSSDALDAGRLYSSLESLRRASGLLFGARYAAEKESAVATGLPAFESEWADASRALSPDARGRSSPRSSRSPAAVRALAEAAGGRIEPLLDGARGFAVAKGPKEGLFYIGEAQGESAFAALCASLELRDERERPPLRSMLPELKQLQDKVNAAFVPPRSIDLHDRFIALNSTLKAALDLDGAQAYAGSTYQYLEAVRHYGMLNASPLDEAAQVRVRDDLDAARARIQASKRDDSLAEIFLERAAAQAAHLDGSAPSADEWRSARVILDQVLPAYFAERLPAQAKASSGKTIRMTLVRWPYT